MAGADACPSWQALYAGLVELCEDLMQHIHLENNVLFPRAEQDPLPRLATLLLKFSSTFGHPEPYPGQYVADPGQGDHGFRPR